MCRRVHHRNFLCVCGKILYEEYRFDTTGCKKHDKTYWPCKDWSDKPCRFPKYEPIQEQDPWVKRCICDLEKNQAQLDVTVLTLGPPELVDPSMQPPWDPYTYPYRFVAGEQHRVPELIDRGLEDSAYRIKSTHYMPRYPKPWDKTTFKL